MSAVQPAERLGPRQLIALSLPALLIGIVSAVVLWLLDLVSGELESAIWTWLPDAVGIRPDNGWWIFGTLSIGGLAVGLVVWLVPGHAGRDSATTELVASPLRLRVLPGLALAIIISLAAGVSLGPENPIIAINTAIAVAALARLWPKVPTELTLTLTTSATIGALFGTPVAAALLFTGLMGAAKGGQLWDKLFLPVAAAGAGSITMFLITGHAGFGLAVAPYSSPHAVDLLSGAILAVVAATIGVGAVYAFPLIHHAFHLLRSPLLFTTAGGILLGVLGVIGGPITLFKGLDQTGELIKNAGQYTAGQFALFAGVKIVALLIAASAGFRGGRIFPAVFIGVAIGLFAHSLVPSVPIGLAIACGVLGFVLPVARDGWMAIFLGVALTGDVGLLPLLCVIVLPAWLIVSRAPEMVIGDPIAAHPDALVKPS